MTMPMRALALVLVPLAFAGCSAPASLYLLEPPAPAASEMRLRVGSVELREVSLPAYAAASEIYVQGGDGALRETADATWADDPVRGVTQALGTALSDQTTARVAVEPWPLDQPADVRIETRIDRMLAGSDGLFVLSGQYAVAAPYGAIRETIEPFRIVRPVEGDGPGAITAAAGAAVQELAGLIARRLAR